MDHQAAISSPPRSDQSWPALELVGLPALMERSRGRSDLMIGLLDGPIAADHPALATARIRDILGPIPSRCIEASSIACQHGTLVAGILAGQRDSATPAICPECTLLVHPIFDEATAGNGLVPSVSAEHLAAAIVACVTAGARVVNLSVAFAAPSTRSHDALEMALDFAATSGAIVVAAAGNQGSIGGSAMLRHGSVIPVAACDTAGRPLAYTNLGSSIGRRGLSAPAEGIASISADGNQRPFGGTSLSAAIVTGAVALLWSLFPSASAAAVRFALCHTGASQRSTVVPPVMNAWQAYQRLQVSH